MPNTSQLQPTVVSCYGGLVLNRDIFTMRPGEALQLTNFEPDIAGGYKKVLGTTAYNLRSDPEHAMIANREFEEGLKRLRSDLVSKQEYMRDERVNLRVNL